MSTYKFIIDLGLCVGCSNCAMACKFGNNTQWRADDQNFNWADFIFMEDANWQAVPIRCNHCENPVCTSVCPVSAISDPNVVGGERRAMYQLLNGMVLHDDDRCVGCRKCEKNCPYSIRPNQMTEGSTSVESYNDDTPHLFWNGTIAILPNCTSKPVEVKTKAGVAPPYARRWTFTEPAAIKDIRAKGIVEKCYFCAHRVLNLSAEAFDRLPYCIAACPSSARKLLTDDADFTGSADPRVQEKVMAGTTPPAGAKVLNPGSTMTPVFVDPATLTTSRPTVYYINIPS